MRMKTKLFTLFLALAASVGTMFAERVQIGDLYYSLNSTDQTAEVRYELCLNDNNYKGLTTANIPASVTYSGTTYSVTSIGNYAFSRCTGLTSVTIPNSVTSIGSIAFSSCSSLTSVTIPNSVTSIGSNAFQGCRSLTSVTIPNSVTSIGFEAFYMVNNIIYSGEATGSPWGAKSVNGYVDGYLVYSDATKTTLLGCSAAATGEIVIPSSVTSIGDWAFAYCSSLTSVTIPNSVTSIGWSAFSGCSSLTTITNYATKPQTIYESVFTEVDLFACTLYVLNKSIALYKDADVWKGFNSIEPIGAIQTTMEDDEVDIIPEDNSIDITWPAVENAYTYELVIKDKNGNVICTLIFNANGQLTSIAFAAPGRGQRAAQVAGFTFTVTSLNSGSEYSYSIAAKGSQGEVLDTKQGSFTTTGGTATALENASLDASPVKVLRNGQIFILRDGKTYTIQGQEVR